ncbi:MAG: hypothetical protein CMK44_00415 [Porticoccus sp.]|nr:hypothetical protein [Porticoccus sp.]
MSKQKKYLILINLFRNIVSYLKIIKKLYFSIINDISYFFLSKKRKKSFTDNFNELKNLLIKNENFGFLRFSDGELFIIDNQKLEISNNYAKLENKLIGITNYSKEETKFFDPNLHQFYREKLIESLIFKKKNYFKGVPCTCCNGRYYTNLVKSYDAIDSQCTYSNLLMNGNYSSFIEEFVDIFKKKKVIFIVSKYANLKDLPFEIVKHFTIGPNCLINDYDLLNEIDEYIHKNKIKDHLFLFAASSLSNLLIHKLFRKYEDNTYIDIGSSLNPYLGLEGWKYSRGYLKEYWFKEKPYIHLNKKCYF